MSITVSALTAGSNNFQTTSEHVNALATDFVPAGVVGAITNTSNVAPMTGAFSVNANGTPNNTVIVGTGKAYVGVTPSSQAAQIMRVNANSNTTVTISANSTGSTRYDWIYISMSAANAANPAVDGSNVASIVTSRSTSATTDTGTPPSYGMVLAVVTVANGFATITNGNIADRRLQSALVTPRNTGEIVAFAGAAAPQGWLICDGSNVSRVSYSALFAAIGTTYGTGDGSTTFGVPNLKGRVPVGVPTGGAYTGSIGGLGSTGGEETHTLTVSEMPSHAHNHNFDNTGGWASGNPIAGTNGMTGQVHGSWSDRSGTGISGLVLANGSGTAHNVLQPYTVVNYIIKT